MKKLSYYAVVALMAAVGGVARADDAKMVLNKADGNTSIPVSGITKLTFEGTTMTVATADGTTQVDVFDLDKITFDLSVSSIDDIASADDALVVKAEGGVITATVASGAPVAIDVYALNGAPVLRAAGKGTVSADLNALTTGVYVVKVNNKVFKLTL